MFVNIFMFVNTYVVYAHMAAKIMLLTFSPLSVYVVYNEKCIIKILPRNKFICT